MLWIFVTDGQNDKADQPKDAIKEILVDINVLYLTKGNRDFVKVDEAFDE